MRNSISLCNGVGKACEKEVKKAVEQLLPAFSYVGGYTGSDGSVELECRECGARITRSMITIRHGKRTTCPACKARKAEEEKRAKQEAKDAERVARQQAKEAKKKGPVACKCCGSLFMPRGSRRSYCSPECSRKIANNHKDKRVSRQEGKDWDITVPALVLRDRNICYLCGELCDSTDYRITDEGYFIAGGRYPSVDHIIPISKGGKHKWDNVKLAHRSCNVKKRDKLI